MVRLLPALKDLGFTTFLPTSDQLRLRNKDRLPELAELAGINCPEIKSITQAGFFYSCQEEGWTYPLVVKGLFYGAYIVHSADEAADAFRHVAAEWGYPVLVQQMVKGEEYNLTAVGDGQGNLLAPVMMKKMAVTDKGKAWSGISIDDQPLLEASVALAKASQWRGPLEVEVMRDQEGRYQLIEINPRFPAWIYLSLGVGRNLPLALLRLILNQKLDAVPETRTGVLFIRYALENIVPLSEFESVVMQGGRHIGAASSSRNKPSTDE
jgi:carbamoyl-phosphate synthase large subunit